jgi:hypothetical protein
MCMDDFNTPVSVRLVLRRHTTSGVPKSGEAGQRKVALKGGDVASRVVLAKELEVREPSTKISRRHVEDVVSHARHPGEDAEAREVMGRRRKWLVITAGEREGQERDGGRTGEGRGKDSRRRKTSYRRTWTTAGRG